MPNQDTRLPNPPSPVPDAERCPRCQTPIVELTTIGPTTHFAAPCGHRVGATAPDPSIDGDE